MSRAMITGSVLDSLVVAVVYIVLSWNLCGSTSHLFWRLMFVYLQLSLFLVASSPFPFCISYLWNLAIELGGDNFSFYSLLFIHYLSHAVLVYLCRPVFSHHSIYGTVPRSDLGKFLCIEQVRRTAVKQALTLLPDVWVAKSRHSVVVLETTLVIRSRD